jgi:regulator of cell morphogenesis and NO signaling
MFLSEININKESFVANIVREDYRTARVFSKHQIDFCCGGKWPLGMTCETKGLDFLSIKKELEHAVRPVQLSNSLPFDKWTVNFLTEYIVNVHHQYLRESLPGIKSLLDHFVISHNKKYSYLDEVQMQFVRLYNDCFPHIEQEETILFPYIRQIMHAYESKEPYAGLLVRTLRKPVENVMSHEHESVSKILRRLRELTNNYIPPQNVCTSHLVAFSLLKELDNDMTQHLFLENQILFPKAITMEKELLLTS